MKQKATTRQDEAAGDTATAPTADLAAMLASAHREHASLFEEHPIAITALMTDFLMPYLRELYRVFDGDVVKAIVLGEIGQTNMRRFVAAQHRDALALELADLEMRKELVRACNGLSVSMASGIAKETVRRKIKDLEAEGLIERHPEGGWQATRHAADRFTPTFNRDLSCRLLDTAVRIAQLKPMANAMALASGSRLAPPPPSGGGALPATISASGRAASRPPGVAAPPAGSGSAPPGHPAPGRPRPRPASSPSPATSSRPAARRGPCAG